MIPNCVNVDGVYQERIMLDFSQTQSIINLNFISFNTHIIEDTRPMDRIKDLPSTQIVR